MTATTDDDRRLIEAAQADPDRFAELYDRYVDRVYAFVSRRTRDRATAEDITSDVFQEALAHLHRFEWRGVPFGAWLFRIASNAITDRWREAVYERALAAGATSLWPPRDQPYGDRVAAVEDSIGTQWFIARPTGTGAPPVDQHHDAR